jgi:formamidopyrimidine-DNA glycosylase
MPELPDVSVYVDRLHTLLAGHVLQRVRLNNVFVLRSVEPPVSAIEGRRLAGARRMGKRIVLEFDGGLFVVIHLMIAGRLRWRDDGRKLSGRLVLAVFEFDHGVLYLTEAGSTRRAMLHVMDGAESLAAFDRGGLDVLAAGLPEFARAAEVAQSHAEARADRPAPVRWHRERVLRRDPAPRAVVAAGTDAEAGRRRRRPAPRSVAIGADGVDRTSQ